MISDAKHSANRANSARSTGPRTREGNRRVSQNALRHGLARTIVRNTFATEEVREIAAAFLDPTLDKTDGALGLALLAAEAQVRLNQISRLQAKLNNDLASACRGEGTPSASDILRQLCRLERYVKKFTSQRRRAFLALSRREIFGEMRPFNYK
jgi:hypothetical protein